MLAFQNRVGSQNGLQIEPKSITECNLAPETLPKKSLGFLFFLFPCWKIVRILATIVKIVLFIFFFADHRIRKPAFWAPKMSSGGSPFRGFWLNLWSFFGVLHFHIFSASFLAASGRGKAEIFIEGLVKMVLLPVLEMSSEKLPESRHFGCIVK